MYYDDKREVLRDLFGARQVAVYQDRIEIDGRQYPVVEDVIIMLDPSRYPAGLGHQLKWRKDSESKTTLAFAKDVQFSFGEEWKAFSQILPEHKDEFLQYFDLVDMSELKNLRICDLGCGTGRWSYFLKDSCRELILIDFSEAIFVARRNLKEARNALFFMADVTELPFRKDFADFIFCLGVLHHLPVPALEQAAALKDLGPRLLIYLYYSLDNRPLYFRILLAIISFLRQILSKINHPLSRSIISWLITIFVYSPLIALGGTLRPLKMAHYVPLCEAYAGKSIRRIRQDVYDRFFTRIEQRYNREEILQLRSVFSRVVISDRMPYWHFVCER